jgi:hypothetical protein
MPKDQLRGKSGGTHFVEEEGTFVLHPGDLFKLKRMKWGKRNFCRESLAL